MAKQVINNLESAALVRSKLNDNFTELYPLTGQTAPTTATVGYLGQVVFDTNGITWTLVDLPNTIYNSTANYIWSPDGIPADGVEYATKKIVPCFDGVNRKLVRIYVYNLVGVVPTVGESFKTIDAGTLGRVRVFPSMGFGEIVGNDAADQILSFPFSYPTALKLGWYAQVVANELKVIMWNNDAAYAGKPFAIPLHYAKYA